MSDLPTSIDIHEEGPREGFQIEKGPIPTERKVELIDALGTTGLRHIQIVSFVDPRRVPGMADAYYLDQFRRTLAAKKPVFIDKPLAGSLKDAIEIARLSREQKVRQLTGLPRSRPKRDGDSSSYPGRWRLVQDCVRPPTGRAGCCHHQIGHRTDF